MKMKKWLIPISIILAILVLLVTGVGVMVSKGYDISTGRYLEAKNGSAILILDNSPIQMSNRTRGNLFDELDTGDKILVIHDGIAESYPGRTGTYAVFKLDEGSISDIPQKVVMELTDLGWLDSEEQSDETVTGKVPDGTLVEETFDVAVSYANWVDPSEIYLGALNNSKMAISSVQHLPIFKFDTLEQFEQFKSSYNQSDMEQGYDEVPSFHDTTAKYDKAFFDENTLMMVYVGASSGTYRFGVNSIYCYGTSFCIHVEQTNNPKEVTDDEAGWIITVAVSDSMVSNCTEFDADLNNIEN